MPASPGRGQQEHLSMRSKASSHLISRFSTTDWPKRDRMAMWRDVIARTVYQIDMAPLPNGPFFAKAVAWTLPGLATVLGENANVRARRTSDLLDGGDDLVLAVTRTGTRVVSQRGREVTLGAGEAILMSSAETSAITFPCYSRFVTLRLSRQALAPLLSNLDDAVMRPLARDTEMLRLLVRYIVDLRDGYPLAAPGLQRAVVTHIYDLVALVIGATHDAVAFTKGRGLRAARLMAIKADIRNSLEHNEVTLTAVAARQRLTTRQLQRLFETEGVTFSEFVLGERLARAHRHLTHPALTERLISTIAFDVGFNELSYFNRTFLRRYGATPSDVRAAARRDQKERASIDGDQYLEANCYAMTGLAAPARLSGATRIEFAERELERKPVQR
jgi:AraC-like DNA-binding protein